MRKLQPPPDDLVRTAIASLARRSARLRYLHRLHAVLLVSLNHSCYEVARWLGEDPRTVERWVRHCASDGVDSLAQQGHGGRPARLTASQQLELTQALCAERCRLQTPDGLWSGKALAQHIEGRYGVCLSVRQCQRLMARVARSKAPGVGAREPPDPQAPPGSDQTACIEALAPKSADHEAKRG